MIKNKLNYLINISYFLQYLNQFFKTIIYKNEFSLNPYRVTSYFIM